jgi:D-3-phosphoglycerate dehydrogenase
VKILCVCEGNRPAMKPYMMEAAKELGNIDVAEGAWEDKETKDFMSVIRRLEVQGPTTYPVPEDLKRHSDADIVIGQFCPFSAEGMDILKNVKIIGVIRGGLETIDVPAATERGILVINASGRNAHAVSDFTVGMLISEVRNIARGHHQMINGNWGAVFPNQNNIPDMNGRTVGLLGFGHIGRLVAKKLSGFDMRIIAHDPFVEPENAAKFGVEMVDKDTLFKEADFVSIHARLMPETRHLVGRYEIDLMKPSAYLINTARSGLVDTEALIDALREKRITGAALDVFDDEPLPTDSPFYKLDNVTLTPHLAGRTIDSTIRSPRLVIDRIGAFIDGISMEGVINPEVAQRPEFKEWVIECRKALGRQVF